MKRRIISISFFVSGGRPLGRFSVLFLLCFLLAPFKIENFPKLTKNVSEPESCGRNKNAYRGVHHNWYRRAFDRGCENRFVHLRMQSSLSLTWFYDTPTAL